jgi:hypothetical protein
MGEALGRLALASIAAAAVIGALGAIVAWAAGRSVSGGVAGAYYIVGCLLFLVGLFPTGGFSFIRGRFSRRRPTGSRLEGTFLVGLFLIALGVVADLTRPF